MRGPAFALLVIGLSVLPPRIGFAQCGPDHVTEWDGSGSPEGIDFDFPKALAADGMGHIFVSDEANYRILRFTTDGVFEFQIGGEFVSTDSTFECVHGIAVDSEGFVYTLDTCDDRLQKFTNDGLFVTTWDGTGTPGGSFSSPQGIAVDDSNYLYIADRGKNNVRKFTTDGTEVLSWGSFGSDTGQFNQPRAIATGPGGVVYVADTGNHRIQKFTTTGVYLESWGSDGAGVGEFNSVRGLTVDADGLVYVCDTFNDRIQRFDPDGAFLNMWGNGGSGPGEFDLPYDATVDDSGFVYIVESRGGRVQKFAECLTALGALDSDCDGLSDADELGEGTDPLNADTDGDGLLDPWEVDSSVAGAGFQLDGDCDIEATRDEVFGPYRSETAGYFNSSLLKFTGRRSLANRPNPLHKDVYLEIDWLDCINGNCAPTWRRFTLDPMHHCPNEAALFDVIRTFREAPVANPDGITGVRLHILVDESLRHAPNCDTDHSAMREDHFGTPEQHLDDDIRSAKELVYRYLASGHSTRFDDQPEVCPTPPFHEMMMSGLGRLELPSYDWSPFGHARIGGRDILVSLGPTWICPEQLTVLGAPPCYRGAVRILNPFPPHFPPTIRNPGIFPAEVASVGEVKAPIFKLLGLEALPAMQQIWGRTIMHLLGHSLGIASEDVVNNDPDAPGMLGVETFDSWDDLQYAPGLGVAGPVEPTPNIVLLESVDRDGDGVVEALDNCRGVSNPTQQDLDGDGYGDACDPDPDQDGLISNPGATAIVAAHGGPWTVGAGGDPFPFDTDNDGVPNDIDGDDDGDGVADASDLCPLVADPGQADLDGDGIGDACDDDRDGDGWPDSWEDATGSDPADSTETIEYVGAQTTGIDHCSDGLDNDGDGLVDGADPGCIDTDGDGTPDVDDGCPSQADEYFLDFDLDDIPDACDVDDDGDGVADGADVCPSTPLGAIVDGLGCATAEVDFDGDGVCDPYAPSSGKVGCSGADNCPSAPNVGQEDGDADGVGDACDNCVSIFNPDQDDSNSNGIGDLCEGLSADPGPRVGSFSLAGSFPNPVERRSTIRFNLPTRSRVTLKVFGVLGRQVEVLADRRLFEPGRHSASLDVERIPPGMYFVRMIAEDESGTLLYRGRTKIAVIR